MFPKSWSCACDFGTRHEGRKGIASGAQIKEAVQGWEAKKDNSVANRSGSAFSGTRSSAGQRIELWKGGNSILADEKALMLMCERVVFITGGLVMRFKTRECGADREM